MPKHKFFCYKKTLLFILCILPFAHLVYGVFAHNLGAEPVDKMMEITGNWALRLLLVTLSISRIRKLFKLNFICYRRMLGLFSFFYALVHFLIYLVFDQSLILADILDDIQHRKYILVGVVAFIILIVLAITSPKWFMKKLKKKWFILHKTIYIATPLALLHYYLLVKSDITEPLIYIFVYIVIIAAGRYADHKKCNTQT